MNQNYLQLSDALFTDIERLCDKHDLDCEHVGNALTISFENDARSQIVINKQEPLEEIWLASRLNGLHFRYNQQDKQWRCTRSHIEFFEALQEACQGYHFDFTL